VSGIEPKLLAGDADNPSDGASRLADGSRMEEISQRARAVRLMVLDVDGVLTDGSLYYGPNGDELKVFNVRDGHGLKMLKRSGVELAIITSRRSRALELRAADLGIERLFQGVADKGAAYVTLLAQLGLEPAAAACMGDDVVDLPLLTRCALALTVPDAPEPVRQRAHYVTRAMGGHGAVREACELIMGAQNSLERQIALHLTPPDSAA
jgi:3-deoxy-D-manno-octulosonate 8-phosphate phosphatase (KDO 8-P phosphatase)